MNVTTIESVKKSVTVNASADRAFEVFTARFGEWWPLATHHTADAEAAGAHMEPRVGGRWFERGIDGSETMWGTVLTWEPPARVVLAWMLNPEFAYDPDPAKASEVEVRFIAEGPSTTRVELEHRNLDRHGDGWEGMREGVGGDQGWPLYLKRYAEQVAA
jgi:hypothetical protein